MTRPCLSSNVTRQAIHTVDTCTMVGFGALNAFGTNCGCFEPMVLTIRLADAILTAVDDDCLSGDEGGIVAG
jgi:hypothetical protein